MPEQYEEIDVGGSAEDEGAGEELEAKPDEESGDEAKGDDEAKRRESGLIHEAQTERGKRQEAETRAAAAEAEARVLREQMARGPAAPEDERPDDRSPLDDLPEDEPIYPGTLKRVIADVMTDAESKAAAKQAAKDEQGFNKRLDESRAEAVANLTKQACGEGLDYLNVVRVGEEHLTAGDMMDIKAAKNPASLAYKRCIERTPELQELVEKRKKDSWIEELNKPKAKKGGSESAGDEGEEEEEPDVVTQGRVVGFSAEITDATKAVEWPPA